MKRSLRSPAAVAIAALCTLVGCPRKEPPPVAESDASAVPSASEPRIDARDIADKACLSCHQMEMLEQQRLTEAQWTKVVTKMQGWGANLEPKDAPPLIAWLSASFGPDAGAWPVTGRALSPITPANDGKYANGKAETGKALFTDRCSGCHGPEARGHIGVNLVDRPFLYRADDFARTVRQGRGKMPAAKIEDAEVADILAHLRSLR
ncbi:MAG: c-type cytochrome [Labilithrix sp.]